MREIAPHCVSVRNSKHCKLQINMRDRVHAICIISAPFPICQGFSHSPAVSLKTEPASLSLWKVTYAFKPVTVSSCHHPWIWCLFLAVEIFFFQFVTLSCSLRHHIHRRNKPLLILDIHLELLVSSSYKYPKCLANVIHCTQQRRWELINIEEILTIS